MSDEEVEGLMDQLMAPHRRVQTGVDEEGNATYRDMNQDEQDEANRQFDLGGLQYRDILYDDIKDMESTYGALLTQMHPRDVYKQFEANGGKLARNYFLRARSLQDMNQLFDNGGQRYVNQDKAENRDFKKLLDYYNKALGTLEDYNSYFDMGEDNAGNQMSIPQVHLATAKEEEGIHGPKILSGAVEKYKGNTRKRFRENDVENELFDKFV